MQGIQISFPLKILWYYLSLRVFQVIKSESSKNLDFNTPPLCEAKVHRYSQGDKKHVDYHTIEKGRPVFYDVISLLSRSRKIHIWWELDAAWNLLIVPTEIIEEVKWDDEKVRSVENSQTRYKITVKQLFAITSKKKKQQKEEETNI